MRDFHVGRYLMMMDSVLTRAPQEQDPRAQFAAPSPNQTSEQAIPSSSVMELPVETEFVPAVDSNKFTEFAGGIIQILEY